MHRVEAADDMDVRRIPCPGCNVILEQVNAVVYYCRECGKVFINKKGDTVRLPDDDEVVT